MRAFSFASLLVAASTGCFAPLDDTANDVAETEAGIYGGRPVAASDAIARSTVALFSEADYQTDHVLVDGSATLVAPRVAVGAAHTCLNFAPRYVAFGPTLPVAQPWQSFDDRRRYPRVRRVVRCVAHEAYDADAARRDDHVTPVHDLALFFFDDVPQGFGPARVLAADAPAPVEVTIAGFGAHEGQFDDIYVGGMEAYGLRAVDSFISEVLAGSLELMDGPNPGRGSCQGDSGGSVYRRRASTAESPVLAAIPVNGPACDEGIGINTDVRPHVAWIERVAGQRVDLAR